MRGIREKPAAQMCTSSIPYYQCWVTQVPLTMAVPYMWLEACSPTSVPSRYFQALIAQQAAKCPFFVIPAAVALCAWVSTNPESAASGSTRYCFPLESRGPNGHWGLGNMQQRNGTAYRKTAISETKQSLEEPYAACRLAAV